MRFEPLTLKAAAIFRAAVPLALVGLFISPAAALAQKPAELSLHFTVFASRPVAHLAYVPRPGAAPVPLVFYPTARSPHYEYRGASPLRLFDTATGEVAVEVPVSAAVHEPLIILTPMAPAPATGPRFSVFLFDDSAAKHAPGGLAILNFSGFALSGTVDGKPATLTAGLNPPYAIGRTGKVVLRTTVNKRTLQSYADNVQLGQGGRALLLLLPPFYQGSAEVQSRLLLDEVTPPPPPRTR